MCLYAVYIQHIVNGIQAHTYTYGLQYLYVCKAHTANICTIICTRYKAIHIAYALCIWDTYIQISACICMYLTVFWSAYLHVSDCILTVFLAHTYTYGKHMHFCCLFISDCIWLYLTVFWRAYLYVSWLYLTVFREHIQFYFATPPEGSPAVAHAMKAPAPPLP